MDLILNSSLQSVLFEENMAYLNILYTVSNSFGSMGAMTVIRVWGIQFVHVQEYCFAFKPAPSEYQDGVTNNCTQLCTHSITNGMSNYECSCNDGYEDNENICDS